MATHDEDLIGQAIAATEKEIFGEAFGQDEIVHDETGDRSNEQMGDGLEGQHEPPDEETESEDADEAPDDEDESDGEEEQEEGEGDEGEDEAESEQEDAEAEPEESAQPQVKPEGRVPSGRLREQTERAERAEGRVEVLVQERDADRQRYDRDIGDLRQRFDSLTAALQGRAPQGAPQASTPSPDTPPDIFENPQGYTDFQNRLRQRDLGEVKQMLGTMRFQNSVDIARAVHGDKFTKAWDAVNKLDARNTDDFGLAQRIFNSPNPGEEILKWHARQETLRVVGDDPEKYKQTITNEVREAMKNDPEFRRQILDELRAEATGDRPSRPARHVTRLPKSLNGAQGQGSNREKTDPDLYDDSDQSVWNSAWR